LSWLTPTVTEVQSGGLDLTGLPYDNLGTVTTTLTLPDGQPVTFYVQNYYDDGPNGNSDRSGEAYAIQANISRAEENMDPHNWYITSTNRANGVPSSRAFALGWSPPFDNDSWAATLGYNRVALNAINQYAVSGGSDQVTVGTVLSDFPNDTPGYIDAIIARNPTPGGWTPSQTGWEPLGEAGGGFDPSKQPAAVSWGANRLDVFAVGEDGQMYHKAWNSGSWSPSPVGWDALGNAGPWGSLAFSSPAAVSWGADRLDVFACAQGQTYHNAWDGGGGSRWSPEWMPLGPEGNQGGGQAPLIGAPAAVSRGETGWMCSQWAKMARYTIRPGTAPIGFHGRSGRPWARRAEASPRATPRARSRRRWRGGLAR
jgi:hypothetical protein